MKTKRFFLVMIFALINVALILAFTVKNRFANTKRMEELHEIHILFSSGCVGEQTSLSIESGDEMPSSYRAVWNYGDGITETINNSLTARHLYKSSGTFTVLVSVFYNGDFIFGRVSQNITIENCGGEVSNNCCDGSFAPLPGKKYVISAWVKEDELGLKTFDNAYLTLVFGRIDDQSIVSTLGPFHAQGHIIDGWQRIEESFEVPLNAETISVRMNNRDDRINAFFDDIRIYPFDGNMKSYVYDPTTKRLVAEMDQNNYATIYEYSDEGEMIRVKKETERGIMTINESRSGSVKIANP